MGYKTAWFCVNCDSELSRSTLMYSNGRCPVCGFKHPSAITIIQTYERAYRLVKAYPDAQWWQFWKFFSRKREWLQEIPSR